MTPTLSSVDSDVQKLCAFCQGSGERCTICRDPQRLCDCDVSSGNEYEICHQCAGLGLCYTRMQAIEALAFVTKQLKRESELLRLTQNQRDLFQADNKRAKQNENAQVILFAVMLSSVFFSLWTMIRYSQP